MEMEMKRTIISISAAALALVSLASCSGTWEEKVNNEWDTKYVWGVAEIANGVLNRAYVDIPTTPDSYGSNYLDVATDNAATSLFTSSAYKLSQGGISSMSNPLAIWAEAYRNIQYVNSFLENGLGSDIKYNKVDAGLDQAYKKQYYGEAHFLRAYWELQLLKTYGGKDAAGTALGFPIRTYFVNTNSGAFFAVINRNTYQECVDQILADCDTAAKYLPVAYTGDNVVTGSALIGKPTAIAAKTIKVIAALYGASPAYQDDAVVKINGMADYEVVDAAAYASKWETAALLANQLLADPAFGPDYYALANTDLADAPNTTPAEFIFRFFSNNRGVESRHFPPYYFGKANTVPSQNLVDAYPMSNGYPIDDPASGYDPEHPYNGRDLRLYNTVYYDGSVFANSGAAMNMMDGGKDSYTYSEYGTKTGYYLKKGLSTKSLMLKPAATSNSQHYFPILRRAQVFFAYAEAANEAWGPMGKGPGCAYSAYDIMKMVRSVAGGINDTSYLDAVAASGTEAFAALIQNERRLEFAFENERYFDLRRRIMPLDEAVRGVRLSVSDEGKVVYDTDVVVSERKFNDIRYYYTPLPYDECAKNKYLVNNMGW